MEEASALEPDDTADLPATSDLANKEVMSMQLGSLDDEAGHKSVAAIVRKTAVVVPQMRQFSSVVLLPFESPSAFEKV